MEVVGLPSAALLLDEAVDRLVLVPQQSPDHPVQPLSGILFCNPRPFTTGGTVLPTDGPHREPLGPPHLARSVCAEQARCLRPQLGTEAAKNVVAGNDSRVSPLGFTTSPKRSVPPPGSKATPLPFLPSHLIP